MLVVEARHMGMCFGVRDALNLMRSLPSPSSVTVHGELVHNPVVIEEMKNRGFDQQTEASRDQPPPRPEVLITAHGVSNKRKEELQSQGYKLHDTTCPLVRRAHKAALHYHKRGYQIILIGKRGHVEVEGLAGDLSHYHIVTTVEDVEPYSSQKLAVVNQTTTRPDLLAQFHRRIRELNPERDIELVDTTCQPTKDRQTAVAELLPRVQALVVVGGPNSNNTRQLGLRAEEQGVPWYRVASAAELKPEWFHNLRIVGLTAGTSTTDETIREVARCLRRFGQRLSA